MVIYKGVKPQGSPLSGPKTVFRIVDGQARILDPAPSQAVYNHSPDGYQWGFNGSGPAQLSLALLLDVTKDAVLSVHLHQDFKRAFVAGWGDEWTMSADEIRDWVTKNDREVMV